MAAVDPNAGLTAGNLEERLRHLLEMPHNRPVLTYKGKTAGQVAREETAECLGSFVGPPQPVILAGPRRLLRCTDKTPARAKRCQINPFGHWWFEEELLVRIAGRLRPWPMPAELKNNLMQRNLREALAVTLEWNPMAEFWRMDVPEGGAISGLTGLTSCQAVHAKGSPEYDPLWLFRGGQRQYYFPVVDPFNVRRWDEGDLLT